MIIGTVSENKELEKRISITPEIAKKYISNGFEVMIEKDLASHLGISDKDFIEEGCKIDSRENVLNKSNIILQLNLPDEKSTNLLKEDNILIGNFNSTSNKDAITNISNKKINVATVVRKNTNKKDYFNKDIVKVVMDNDSNSIYFSREPIPHNYSKYFYSHIGIYAYKVSALHSYTKFKQSLQEKCESLEQLRFLCNGISIKCVLIKQNKSISINSNNDLKLARKLF